MISGCLKNVLAAIGCLTVLAVTAVVSWQYRVPIERKVRAVLAGTPGIVEVGPGHPSPSSLRDARRKYEDMADTGGPDSVTLTPSEMAALIADGLDPRPLDALDSLSVTLDSGRVVLHAGLLTDVWGRTVLGPLAGVLQPREPLRIAGTARMIGAGVLAWEPDEFTVRSLSFPRVAIGALVNSLTGGIDGAIRLSVPATVRDVRIRPHGVTFYRQEQ